MSTEQKNGGIQDGKENKSEQPRKTDGNASFLRAARAGNLEKVLDFLKGSIDINTSNANGLNALHLAAKEGHVNVVTELLKRGANIEAATKKGNTALHITSLAGQEEIVKILVQNHAKVNVQATSGGFTPLYMAAQENHCDVVKYLLGNGASQTLSTDDGFTPLAVALQQGHDKVVAVLLENDTRGKVKLPALHIAAKKDDVKAASLLLSSDHAIDSTSKSGFTPLHIASHYGNVNVGALLIEKGADVNFKARNNITPLHVSSKWGRVAMVTLLLDGKADIASRTRDGLTPLHCGARSGHDSVVDQLLERGAPVAEKTKNGLSPLHMAAQGDHVDCARLLLFHKAPLDDVTMDYLTPLHVAAHCGNVRTAKLLLDKKCEVDSRALNGFTPLHIACKKNRIKVVELLLKYGASIQATTESGLTPLHVASFMGHMNIVIYLIQHGANPDTPTMRGETALHLAARANQTDIIRILLRNGAQVDARAREQQTPLHIASRLGNVDNVVLLLQHGASADATTKDNYSPLHIAAKEGHEEVTAVLLEHGSSQQLTTKKGFTPLHIAAKYGHIKVARLLLQKDADPNVQGKNGLTPLHVATHYNNVNVALLLLESGASPHATAKNGYTPLHIAAKKNQMDIATTLIEYGAVPDAESKNGFTSLHLAAQEGHTEMVSLLLEHKANVNSTAKNGLTPLHLAAQEDKVPVAEVLVKYDAQIDPHTKAGYTPLHTACHFGQINMIRYLLEQGASVNATTKLGYTPLHQAAQQGHVLVINLLLKYNADPDAITTVGPDIETGQTPLSIAQKLGYISVVEILKNITEVQPAASDEKYKVVSPETMQEADMTDSEEEGGDDTLLGDQSYQYLSTDDMKILQDDSISPIREERDFQYFERYSVATSERFSTLSSVDSTRGHSMDRSSSMGRQSSIPPPTIIEGLAAGQEAGVSPGQGYTHTTEINVLAANGPEDSTDADYPSVFETVNTIDAIKQEEMVQRQVAPGQMAGRAMSEASRDNTMYGSSYSGVSFASSFDPDNVAVDRHPQYSGFLVSFMVDARGGAMRGCRHSGVRIIVPPGKACMPTRVTCKLIRKDKLPHPPPIMESEALASRILEMGPVGAKFLGPVIIEVPHFASLRDQEREIVILRSNDGQTWREHTMEATDEAIHEALNGSFEGEDLESAEELYQKRITRILTTDFPHYFAVVTRVRKEAKQMGADGGMLSSSVVPHVQVVFPPGALTKKTQVGLQAQPVPPELVSKQLGNRVAVSPLVTVEPRRRRFHAPITVTIPVPRAAQKGMLNQYGGETPTLRLLCSITGGMDLAQWEDITGSSPLTFVNDCVSFTTNVSARFWLMDCQNYKEATRMATDLYREVIAVPFMSKFVVFAKRHDPMEARLRVFCMTDDKMDKTLETQEHFSEVARSRDVEVLEGKPQYVEMGGNIVPVTKSGEQLFINFHAFRENRLPFVVRIRDPNQEAIGRLAFMREPKVARGEAPQPPICNLNITLPICTRMEPQIELDADELKHKYDALRGAPEETIVRADLRLTDLADALQGDWVLLARQLGWTEQQIASIQAEEGSEADRAMAFLHEWVQSGQTGYELNMALRAINRQDVITHCKHNEEEVTDELEKAVALSQLEPVGGFDAMEGERGSARDPKLIKGMSLDVSYDEKDLIKESESAQEESDSDSVVENTPEVSEDVLAARLSSQEEIVPQSQGATQAAPCQEVITERQFGDLQTRSEVSERQEKTEEGRTLRIKVTVTKHTKPVTETTIENGVLRTEEFEELVGTEIEEDVMDLAPGLTAPKGDNIEMATKVQHSDDTDEMGVWTRKTVKTTVVNVVPLEEFARTIDEAPGQDQLGDNRREIGTVGGALQGEVAQFRPAGTVTVIEGDVEQSSEVSESQDTLEDGTTVRTTTTVTQYYKPITEVVTITTGEQRTTREEPVGTEIDTDILYLPEGVDEPVGDDLAFSTEVEKSEATNPDGTFVRRITKTTKVTIVQLADKPESHIVKGDVQTKTEVSQSEDILADGTTVKTTTTVTEHFTPVTETYVVDGVEETDERDEVIGTEILEDILQLPAGVDDPNADNVESTTDVQESESTKPDGSWVKKTTKKTVVTVVQLATPQGVPEPEPVEEDIEPEAAPVVKSTPPPKVTVVEGKVESRKYMDEDEKTLDDGTVVKSRTTTTRHIKPITTITTTYEGDESKKLEEKLIGTEIWGEVFEYSPDYDESLPQNIKHDSSAKHHEEEKEDGSWLRSNINTTKITVLWSPVKRLVTETKPADMKSEDVPSVQAASEDIAVVPVIKAVFEGDIKLVTEVSESEDVKDDGSKAKTVTKTIKHIKPITEVIEIQGVEEKREREVLVGTEIEEDVFELPAGFNEAAPPSFQRKVNVQESEETDPEGAWVKKTVKVTQVIPIDAPAIDEEAVPIVKSTIEGDIEQRTTVSESADTLEDGTLVKTVVTAIQHVKPITEVVQIGGVEEERRREVLVGTEISEDIVELPVGFDENIPQNVDTARSVQESQDTKEDGSWFTKKVTKTSVTFLDAPITAVQAPALESAPVSPYVKEVKEGEVVPQTSVEEFEDTLPDGTVVKTKITTTRLICQVTEVVIDNGEEKENTFEKLVGTEIDEDITEIPVGYDENIPQNLERQRAVQEGKEVNPDGSYTLKKTTKTTIRLLEDPKPVVKERKEGEIVKSVDVKESEETLENFTVVHTKVTTTTLSRPVTEIIEFMGEESVEEKVEPVGTEIDEEITEMPRGYNPDVQQNLERARSVEEQMQRHEDGTFTQTKTTKVAIKLLEPVVLERLEGDIIPSTDIKQFEQTLPDGALEKTKVTTTTLERPVKEVTFFNGVEATNDRLELVGTEVDKEIDEYPVGFDESKPQNIDRVQAVEEGREKNPDGTYTHTKITKTTVRILDEPKPVILERKEGDITKTVDVKESEETLENATVVHTKITTTTYSRPVTEKISFQGQETVEEKVEPVGTEIDEEITEMPKGYNPDVSQNLERARSVQEQKQGHGDGTYTNTKTTKVSIRLLEPVVLQRTEGDIVPSTDVEEFESTKPDGTLVKTKVTTTTLERPVTEVIIFNAVEETKERMELVGKEIDEDITEIPVGYDESIPQNLERSRAVQEGKEGHPDGSYTAKKTTKTTIRLLEDPKPVVKERKEGDIVKSVDVKESDETLENGTVVHTKITTTTHSKPVTEIIVFKGEESVEEKVELVGTEIDEEITEMPKGYNPDVQQSLERGRSVQEQKQGHGDGTWTHTKTTKVAIRLLEPVVLQRTEGDIVPSTDVEEFESTKPDGTLVKTKVTTTTLERPVTERIIFNAVEETKERMELVGKEIDEDITEIPVGYDENIPQNIERSRAVEEGKEGHPDGSYTAKKTTKTTIRLLEDPKPVVKERKEGDIVKSVDVKESDETLENGTVIHTKITTTTHSKPVTEVIVFNGEESVEEKVELVGTEIDEEITEKPKGYNPDVQQSIERGRSVQEQKQGHKDGTWTHTKTTKVNIRLLEPVVLERTEGEVTPSTSVEEFENTLPDGVLAKTTVTTTKHERPVKELIIFNGVEETREITELVGTDIEEDITEIPPTFDPHVPQNIEKVRSVQEERGKHGDGSYTNKKVTKTIIKVLGPAPCAVDESEILPTDVIPDRSAPPPAKEPTVRTVVGDEDTRTEEKESEVTNEDGSITKTKETTVTHFQPIVTITEQDGEETSAVTEKHLGTEIFTDITEMPPGYDGPEGKNIEMSTATESGEETNSDGIWTKRVTTKQTIKVLSEAEVAAGVSTEPQKEETECDESEETLPDGTVCRKRVLTTRTNTRVIRRVVTEVNGQVVGDVETVEELAGDGKEAAPPVDEEILSPEDQTPSERVPPQQPVIEEITPDVQALAEHAPPPPAVDEDQIVPDDQRPVKNAAPVPSDIIPEDQTPVQRMPVGEGEIQPDIVVSAEHAPPRVDATSPASQPPAGDVEEIEEVLPDGTVVKRRIMSTKMRKVVTRKIRRVGPDGEIIEDVVSEEVPESELLSGSSRGSSMRSSLSDIHDLTSPYTPVSPSLDMGSPYHSDSETGGVKIYTDTIEGEPQVETDVQETEETLPDGTVVRRKVIKTKQKQTIVKRVVMEGPENDMPTSEEQAQMVLAQGSMEPEMKYTDYMEGAPETTQDVQETEETLEDGSVVKKKVITTTEQQLKTERTVIEGGSEIPEFAEDELFPEAAREAQSRPHPVFDEPSGVDEDEISPDMQQPRFSAPPAGPATTQEPIDEDIKVTASPQSYSQPPAEKAPQQQVVEEEIQPDFKQPAHAAPLPADLIASNGVDGQSAASKQEGDESQLVSTEGELDEATGGELQTTRLVLKKQVHKKTVIRDGKEETIVTEDTHVEQDNEGPDELREDMQRVVDDFMEGKDLDAE